MRYFLFLIAVLTLAGSPVLPAWAQEAVGVRAGEHEDYSRIVLDGAGSVPYTKEVVGGNKLTLTFKKEVTLDMSQMPAASGNILGYSVGGNTSLSIDISEGSRTRDFKIGKKLVVDIYNPPGGKAKTTAQPPKETAKAEEVKPEPQPEEKPDEKTADAGAPPQEELAKIDVKPAEEAKPKEMATAPAEPEKPAVPEAPKATPETMEGQLEALQQEEAVDVKKGIQVPMKEETTPNLITLTSTQEFGMAAFENHGNLFLVINRKDELLEPQVSGPNAIDLSQFKKMPTESGEIFYIAMPARSFAKAEGSGLFWRVTVSGNEKEGQEVIPKRVGVEEGKLRSGSLLYPIKGAASVFDIQDPVSGAPLKVVTVADAKDTVGKGQEFVDFEIIPAAAGMVIRPKVDGLMVSATPEGVEISRPGGLALMPQGMVEIARIHRNEVVAPSDVPDKVKLIYKFHEWQMGGTEVLHQNKNIVLAGLQEHSETRQAEDLIMLGKMYLAGARGAEALGFFRFAAQQAPEIQMSPEYVALRGAAKALDWKSEEAFRDLSDPILEPYGEVQYWRAYTLADLGDWEQAASILPNNFAPIYNYPDAIRSRLGLVLAEIRLRAGDVAGAEELLGIVEGDEMEDDYAAGFSAAHHAALNYLKGEAARQKGKYRETFNLWQPLTEGPDDLYRAKAGLALTRLLIEQGSMDAPRAIDQLERLRYSWRGDDLEAQINYWLGKEYFDSADYMKGLTIMRDAATFAPDTDMGRLVTRDMAQAFSDLYLKDGLDDVSPLDAIAIYEQFTELVPTGEKGDQVVERLSERLVEADLLERAGDLLEHQVRHRLTGEDALRVSVNLAGIRLLDNKPDKALQALNNATKLIRELPAGKTVSQDRFNEISLLRARALSKQGKTDQALALLNDMEESPDVNRLKVDISWNAGYWDDAAEALDMVIADEAFSLTRTLKPQHAELLLNRAIALNLASDRIGLANMREKYSEPMSRTDKASMFEVVTRPRQSPALADRDTLLSVTSEVDLFSGFLRSYRQIKPKKLEPLPGDKVVSGEGAAKEGAAAGAGNATPAQ